MLLPYNDSNFHFEPLKIQFSDKRWRFHVESKKKRNLPGLHDDKIISIYGVVIDTDSVQINFCYKMNAFQQFTAIPPGILI